jgi:hypothetical protein
MIHDDFSYWTAEVPIKTFPKGVNTLSGSAQGTMFILLGVIKLSNWYNNFWF